MGVVAANLLDSRTTAQYEREAWSPLMLRGAEIEEAFQRLESGPQDAFGRREYLVVHPQAAGAGRGLSPTQQVALGVLLPGETTQATRDNTTGVAMCLGGRGEITLGDRAFTTTPQDVWTKPSMALEQLSNTGTEPFRYLRYSNAAVLERLAALYRDGGGKEGKFFGGPEPVEAGVRAKDLLPLIPLAPTGESLMPYEYLIDPEYVDDRPLHFMWNDIEPHLSGIRALETGYTGRPLFCLYNPATGRLNGTTPSFFATIAAVGPNFGGGTHRHMSSALNYHFRGSGYSIVNGERVDWEAGDLMLSAPAWAEHGHVTGPEGAFIFTVQDHPFHIANGSLVWQEDIEHGEVLALGTQEGFQTNIREYIKEG